MRLWYTQVLRSSWVSVEIWKSFLCLDCIDSLFAKHYCLQFSVLLCQLWCRVCLSKFQLYLRYPGNFHSQWSNGIQWAWTGTDLGLFRTNQQAKKGDGWERKWSFICNTPLYLPFLVGRGQFPQEGFRSSVMDFKNLNFPEWSCSTHSCWCCGVFALPHKPMDLSLPTSQLADKVRCVIRL